MKEIIARLHVPNWLLVLLSVTLLLRVPSFFEPFSYGDETIYLTLGEGIRQGLTLYREVYDNKPPLLYLLAALAGNVFWFKAILAFWNFASIVLFWKLSQALFPEKARLHKIATIAFALLTTIPLLEGNIANAEVFMVGPTILAFLLLFARALSPQNLILAGGLFAIAALFKIPAAFELPIIIVYWLVTSVANRADLKILIRRSFYLTLGFLIPILLTFGWFSFAGALKEYLAAAFLQNVGYLSSWRPGDIEKSFLARNLPLITRALVVLLGILVLYLKRAKLSKKFVFLSLWVLFALFAVTLSERPYPHYLIQIVAPVSFLFAIFFSEKTLEQSLVIIPLSLALFVPFYYKFWYYSTSSYYLRFLNFALGRSSKETYLANFGRHVPNSYEIADFLVSATGPKEKVFVWGPESQTVYALARRLPPGKFVADYHINDFSTKEAEAKILEESPPKYIIFLPGSQPFPEVLPLLRKSYLLISEVGSAEVWRRTTLTTP